MYKLMIADDEPIVVEGLRDGIDWKRYNIEVVGCAYNGIQAEEVCRKELPDIIITDIKMPGADGLDFLFSVRHIVPHARFIIVSAFEVFSYAKTAIELNVQAAIRAKSIGATHVIVSRLTRSRWIWEQDKTDPYPNWLMAHSPLFKLVCPPELEKYLPTDYVDECFSLLCARCEVLKKYGLKGALFSNEPFWLPEAVFRDHPSWRGTRLDHPRRARVPYYSPCVDNPEVLALYEYEMKELCSKTGIDFFLFKSNDAGGGLCWSSGTYVGPNGPESCRERSMSERVCGFVEALAKGAREGGVEPVIHFNTKIGFKAEETEVSVAWHELKDAALMINDRDMNGEMPMISGEMDVHPSIKGIPHIFRTARFLERAASGKKYMTVDITKTDLDEKISYLKRALASPTHCILQQFQLAEETAKEIVGEKYAAKLVDAWQYIHEGEEHFSHSGLDILMYGCIHQRWINRPFVLFPEELTEEERSYYRPFQFQALDEKHANDLLDMQNIECVRGFSASFLLSETVKQATGSFRKAIASLEEIRQNIDGEVAEKLSMVVRRLEVYICLMKTCVNASRFQTLADSIDYEAEPALSCQWPTRNDPRIEQYQDISRSEIDNAYRLADLIEGHEKELLQVTEPEMEDIFVLSRNIAGQIRRKAEIMLDHQLDGNRVFERNNI